MLLAHALIHAASVVHISPSCWAVAQVYVRLLQLIWLLQKRTKLLRCKLSSRAWDLLFERPATTVPYQLIVRDTARQVGKHVCPRGIYEFLQDCSQETYGMCG